MSRPNTSRLMQWVHTEEWPRLEKDLRKKLVYSNPGIYTGPPCERYHSYVHAVAQEGVDVELLTSDEARERFPQFTFEGVESALLDKTGGFISSVEAIESLTALARENGVRVLENTVVHGFDPASDPVRVETSGGTLETERLVVAAGAWAKNLLPFLKPSLNIARQTVGYFTPDDDPDAYRPGRFPVWAYREQDENNLFYGMPEFGRAGVKVGRHLRVGVDDDPDNPPDAIDQEKIADVKRFIARFFTCRNWTLAGAEHCLYTNAPNEDFIIDLHPENPRIAFGAGFSGHGFKFGPLTGRLLAELAWEGENFHTRCRTGETTIFTQKVRLYLAG